MSTSLPKFENDMSDNELVAIINSGEYECFKQLIKRYQPYIRYTASSLLVDGYELDDLIQEGNVALYFAVQGFKDAKASFSTYACACIKNAMIDVLRKQTSKGKIPDSMFSSLSDVEPYDNNTPEKIFFDNEGYRLLTDSIKIELSKLEYAVLIAFLSGLSYIDIAKMLGVSAKSVDNSLKRVRNKLKNFNNK